MTVASSASVAGAGAVALTGPDSPSSARQCRIAPTSSSRVIQLRYWSPEPIRPPSPTRKRGSCLPQAPPWRLQHDAGAEEHDPDAGLRRRLRRCLPGPADLGQESGSRRRVLGQFLVPPVAVDADGRGTDQDGGRRRQAGRRCRPAGGWSRPAVEDDPLAVRRPPPVADAGTGQVDDAVERDPPARVRPGRSCPALGPRSRRWSRGSGPGGSVPAG